MLNYVWLVFEILCEIIQKLICVFNHFHILSNNPYNWGLGFWVVKRLQIFTDVAQKPFILVWIFSENVSHDDNWLLYHIRNFGFQCLWQALHTLVSHFLQLDCTSTHRSDSFSHEFHINLLDTLFQMMQNHQNVFIVGDLTQNLQFFHFHIQRIMIIDKKDFELFRQEQRSFL